MDVSILPQLMINGVVLGASYAVLGLAMALILGVTGRFHFALSFTFTLSAFVAAVGSSDYGIPAPLALVLGVLAGSVVGVLIEILIYRPLADRSGKAALLPIFVSSLGIAIAGQYLIQLLWARTAVSVPFNLMPLRRIALSFGLTVTGLDLLATVILLLAAGAGVTVLKWTRVGQIVRGVRGNPTMARAVGIRPESVFLLVFLVSSGAAGLVATLTAAQLAATPDMGNSALFSSFVVAFLAGTRGPALRVVLVGLGLGVVESVSGLWIPSNLTNLVVFGLLLGYLVLRGTGALRLVGIRPLGA